MSTSSVTSSTTPGTATSAAGLNSLGGTLQITGLASGLNTDQIITELLAIKAQPITALQNQEAGIKARDTALTSMQTTLQTVFNDAQALEDPSLFHTSQQVTSSDSTRVSASSSTGAGVGGYQVSVSQLANSAQRTFTYASPTADDSITIDGHATTIKAGESISDFVNSINNDSSSTVYAAATDSGTVVFSDRATGDTGTNFIQVADGGGALTEQTAKAKQGQNALYSVDGVSGSSSSNTVTGAIAGVSLTLSGVTTSSGPITIDVSPPAPSTANVTTALQTFVTDYNSAISAIQTQLTTPPSSTNPTVGTLYQDPELSQLLSSMRSAMYSSGSGLPSGLSSLLDLGVSTGATTGSGTPSASALAGTLTLDTSKLTAALQANPTGVQQDLIAWSQPFSSLVSDASGPGGTISTRMTTDGSTISNLDNQIADMQASLAQQQTDLTNQYAALEATLSQNQAESASLTSQLASLPGG